MSDRRSTSLGLLAFAVLNLVAVVVLNAAFGWPAVLGDPAAEVLPKFSDAQVVITLGFLLQVGLSVALVPIAIGLHREANGGARLWPLSVAAFGVLTGLTQTLGWIRWPITMPGLADTWVDPATTPEVLMDTEASFDLLNAYAGNALGEYLGWLFQALWAVGIATLLFRSGVIGARMRWLGTVLTGLWAISFLVGPFAPALSAEPFASVGFTASGLRFLWLGAVGIFLLRPATTEASAA
ncbi:MAG: DUF4386 family protein [Ornithinimicrobium sp.]